MEASIVPYDCIIIGAGPAGITASIYLARKKLDVLVLSQDLGGQASLSSSIENYLGYRMITGPELVKKFDEHMQTFGIELKHERVKAVRIEGELFSVETDRYNYLANSVIIASGKTPLALNCPGEKEFIGRGVTYCAICDAPIFKDLPVVVVGGGNSALDAVLQLSKFTKEIYLVNITPNLGGDEIAREKVMKLPYVRVFNNCKIASIQGDTVVRSVEVQDIVTNKRFKLEVRGVFVEIGLKPGTDIELPVKLNERKEIIVDKDCKTSVPGIFAAGDVTDTTYKQIIIAAGEGAKAALSAYEYLRSKKEFLNGKYK
ncbi:MAG: FAD-dependent oxidoreductase [Candidatus Aenigmarchaeota archaeon]|nr:FAD-dependent oxidoreductase [Candidatus Aenigmarchaeota archaeon]